jgi:hypothetical protein
MSKYWQTFILTDLQHEAGEAPRVVVHDDSSTMTDHLNSASNRNQRCKRPLLPAVALVDMNKHADAENGDEDGVGNKVWLILEDAPLDVACFEVTFSPASLLRSIGGHCLLFVSKPWTECSGVVKQDVWW